MTAAFVLILALFADNAPIAVATTYFPSRDLCEAGAAQVKRDIPGAWRHSCVPVIGGVPR